MDRTPDLSHLTDQEKKIIQAVINRQKADETNLDEHDYSSPSIAISSRSSSQFHDSGVVCQLCQRTKFVNEQSSRQCSICHRRFCVRCGIRLKSQTYLCNQCRQKQEQYFSSSSKNICKQYLSDYILSQTHHDKPFGANQKRIPPKLKSIGDDDDPSVMTTGETKKRLLPEIKQNLLRDLQYHSLEERDLPPESTLKDSGIDTASSSTILNVISSEKFPKPLTYWRWNENRTEQLGYIYLNNNNLEQGKNIFDALGLQIQNGEITNVSPGSLADTSGQLRIGDQILEWNGEKYSNQNATDLYRISMQSSQIHLLVKRIIPPRNDEKPPPIQLQISFQYDQKHFYVMIYGARNIPIQQGLLACQLSLQYERDTLERCTKAQPCSSGMCTWNQRIIFFDLNNLDQSNLSIKLINLEVNQEVLGEIAFSKFNFNNKSEWYNLIDSLFNRGISSATNNTPLTANHRKRQLPDIPVAQLHANRERVSQDLFQKATELKLRLHMQSRTGKALLTQRSFDQTQMKDEYCSTPRKSMVNLSSVLSKNPSMANLKEKLKIPMIRDKSAPNTVMTKRTTPSGQNETSLGKAKLKSLEDNYRKTITKRYSLDAADDEIDSDGFDLPSISNKNSTEMLSERSRTLRKPSMEPSCQIQLNEEELRQMEMRTYETIAAAKNPPSEPDSKPSPIVSTEKVNPRTDGTLSDSGLSIQSEPNSKRRVSKQSKAFVILGLSKKANSSASLGYGRRCGFQRSEEIGVQPHLRNRALERQTSKENETPTSAPATNVSQPPFNTPLHRDQYHSMPTDMKLWSGALKLPHEHQFTDFIEGLGKGQLVGRQVLASPCHGEIQIGLREQHGLLEVEIVRARNLPQKVVYKTPPAPYVKVYLLDGKKCLEKQRTRTTTRRTLDPLIQQTLSFKENFHGKVLQISIWGDYGKLDRKVFMGVCQIGLEEVNLNSSHQSLDWYKLFSTNSLLNNYTIVQQSPRRIHSVTTMNRF